MDIINEKENKNQLRVQSNSDYPQSIEESRLNMHEQTYINRLSQKEQQIVSQYLATAKQKNKKLLISQRDDLLQQLHHMNSHLSQMIDQLYGTINTLSNQTNHNLKQQSQPQLKTPLNQPKMSKKHNQIQQSPHKSIPYDNKSPQKDQLKNMNINQLDFLQQKNLKLVISLQQQIQDYEFMLTGQYWDRLDQQLQKETFYKKQLQQQISQLNKTVHKHTKSYDKQIITKLQKSTYDKQVQLTIFNKKVQSKQKKLHQIEKETKQKIQKIKKLQEQQISLTNMVQMYEDDEYEGPQSERRKKDKYQKLLNKKLKLQKIINSLNNNNLKLYNRKLFDFRSLHNHILQYNELTKQIDYNLMLIVKERKQFQEKNKHLLNKSTMISSLQNQFPYDKLKSQPRQIPEHLQGLFTSKNRLKTYSHHAYQTNPKLKQQVYETQTKKHDFKNQNTLDTQPQNSLRRRVYTQLQNSHFFSSLERKHQKAHSPIQQYITPKNQYIDRNIFKANKIVQQKKFNSSVKPDERIKLKSRQEKIDRNQKIKRKGDSIERQVQAVDKIQERLKNLEQFLKKDEINLSTLNKIQQKLYSSKFNKITPSYDENYNSQPSRDSTSKFNQKNTQRSQPKHYKELCDRLGKNRLLIEQDVDISGLIYQGMSGKT